MGIEMNSTNICNVKLFAAVVGGSAMVVLGAVSVAIAQQSGVQDMAAPVASVSAVTTTTPVPAGPVEEAVMKAAPAVTAVSHGAAPNRVP
jgi:hypothetical protein